MTGRAILACFAAFLVAASACSSDRYADVRPAYEKLYKVQEKFISKMRDADDADDLAKAIDDFSDGMAGVREDMAEAEEKHPELKDPLAPPEGLAKEYARREELAKTIIEVSLSQKIIRLSSDPKVVEANRRLAARTHEQKD